MADLIEAEALQPASSLAAARPASLPNVKLLSTDVAGGYSL